MMQSALANAFFTGALVSSPVSVPFDRLGYSNVVHVDRQNNSVHRLSTGTQRAASSGVSESGEWRSVFTARLSALRRLAPGWDGSNSEQLSDDTLSRASRILDVVFNDGCHHAPPATVPCADGSLQLEWWLVDTRFELAIEANGHIEGWALDRSSGREISAENAAAIELLSKWAGRLTADKFVLQA